MSNLAITQTEENLIKIEQRIENILEISRQIHKDMEILQVKHPELFNNHKQTLEQSIQILKTELRNLEYDRSYYTTVLKQLKIDEKIDENAEG